MKKLLLSLAAASMMFVACKKESEAVLPTSTSEATTGNITFKVYAETNEDNADRETAPDGTVVVATATHSGNTYVYESAISGGSVSFDIPAMNTGTTVSFTFSDFRTDVTEFGGTVTEGEIFTATTANVTLMPGVSEIRDITYFR